MDRLEEAESTLNRALVIRETAYTLICLGELYEKMGQEGEARLLFQRALGILEDSVEHSHAGLKRVQAHLQHPHDTADG